MQFLVFEAEIYFAWQKTMTTPDNGTEIQNYLSATTQKICLFSFPHINFWKKSKTKPLQFYAAFP